MSITITVDVECERDGCRATFTGRGWPDDVRRAARRAGWSSKPDRCPTHPPGDDIPPPSLLDMLETTS